MKSRRNRPGRLGPASESPSLNLSARGSGRSPERVVAERGANRLSVGNELEQPLLRPDAVGRVVAAHEQLGNLLGRQAVGELLQQPSRTVGRGATGEGRVEID